MAQLPLTAPSLDSLIPREPRAAAVGTRLALVAWVGISLLLVAALFGATRAVSSEGWLVGTQTLREAPRETREAPMVATQVSAPPTDAPLEPAIPFALAQTATTAETALPILPAAPAQAVATVAEMAPPPVTSQPVTPRSEAPSPSKPAPPAQVSVAAVSNIPPAPSAPQPTVPKSAFVPPAASNASPSSLQTLPSEAVASASQAASPKPAFVPPGR
jgi:hypothetical protein